MTVELIPLLRYVLVAAPTKLKENFGRIGTQTKIVNRQETDIIYSTRILQNVLQL